jgi:DNA-binding NtrC family response regulator
MNTETKHAVLLVDDEPEILYSLKGLLRRQYELHTAESAKEAIEVLAEHDIHVIMTDQRMPEITGSEFLAQIKTTYPDAIRIVFTGYADIKAVIEAVNKGGLFRYLTKPWDPDELVEVLEHATKKYDEIVETRRLLRDVEHHLQQVRPLLATTSETANAPATDPEAAAKLRGQGDELLARLAQRLAP